MDQKIAEKIVRRIIQDIDERIGYKLCHLHDDVKAKIKKKWVGIVLTETPPEPVSGSDREQRCPNCGYSQSEEDARIQRKRDFVHGSSL